jgi:hypothetical protein
MISNLVTCCNDRIATLHQRKIWTPIPIPTLPSHKMVVWGTKAGEQAIFTLVLFVNKCSHLTIDFFGTLVQY